MNAFAWSLSELEKHPKNGLTVMSTFACGGGSSMGYKLAGCDVIAANDIDPEMAYHYQFNLDPKHYFLCPIEDLLTKGLPEELFNLDILDGSPPCSTFSMSGGREKDWGKDKHFREGQSKQVLSDLFFDYLNLVERLRPKVAIAENVKGMLLGNARGYTRAVMRRFREIGYRPQLFLLNAADCGVPQRRERVFFCAVRDDLKTKPLRLSPQSEWISVGKACEDLQDLTENEKRTTKFTRATELDWWHKTPPGKSFSYAREQVGKSGYFNHVRLNINSASNTLTAHYENITHWSEARFLTFREFKRLGSFPEDYKAKTDEIGKYMVGMSVPPKMTEVVARAVCSQWLGA